MFKFPILFIFTIILLIVNINTEDSIDLSDDNPVSYCLKAERRMTLDEIKEYYLKTQKPEYAKEYNIDDPMFYYCVEQASREDD